jgi:hypothetical protein
LSFGTITAGSKPVLVVLLAVKRVRAEPEQGEVCSVFEHEWRPLGSMPSLMPRDSNPACELDACLRDKVKLRRAYGECLGSQRR